VEIYGQIGPVFRNEQPGAVLLDVSLGVTLFADDVGIRELLVQGEPVIQHGGIAVNVDDVVTRIHTVVVGEGQLPELQDVDLGIRVKDSIVVAVYAIIRDVARPRCVIALFAGRDPDGTCVQLLDELQAPARPAAEVLVNMGGSRQRIGVAAWQEAAKDVAPQRLGHSLLFTAQPQQMTAFYTQVLGLRVSDTIHGLVTFLNAGAGDHHVFGFIASTHRGFHHASFEVPSIDAIAVGADRMRAKGREPGWGLGRHTIGSNFFHYNPDPWGSWIEWFSDIDQIDDCWVASDWDVPPHLWGTPPPETFLANQEPAGPAS